MANGPHDFTVISGVRSAEAQNALYAKGRAIQGDIVTNADGYNKKSNHQIKMDGFGYAVDFLPIVNKMLSYENTNEMADIAKYIKKQAAKLSLKVAWGGDWISLKDLTHIELEKV
jgi:peptidoglycan L-alanyl-D-glutamate endopeptidase CwlK